MKFLRFIVSINDVMMNSQRVEIIEDWSILKSFHEVQIFLEFVNFYQQFIKAYSWIASLLISLLKESKNEKKTESFQWLNNTEKIFSRLKEVFMIVSVLVHFNSELKSEWRLTHLNKQLLKFTHSFRRCLSCDTLSLIGWESWCWSRSIMRHISQACNHHWDI